MIDFISAGERLIEEFGTPYRVTLKVEAWDVKGVGVVLQIDQPNREAASYIWVPYPNDGESVPEIALEFPEDAGRHSGTYASSGLEKGKPALKIIVRTDRELNDTINYIRAMSDRRTLPTVEAEKTFDLPPILVDSNAVIANQESAPKQTRREAIPRAVQRDIWRRDEGKCVECSSKERLCFDHIIPFSRGGSNTSRNLQLLCERCNLSKGNRI